MGEAMNIIFHEGTRVFHLYNGNISYLMMVLPNGQLGQLYFGKRLRDRADFSDLLEVVARPMSTCVFEDSKAYSMEHIKQEYPVYGATDYRYPAVEVRQKNGSTLSEFVYDGYEILQGKPGLPGLPATYVESPQEAQTLVISLKDPVTEIRVNIRYTIFARGGILAKSVCFVNEGTQDVHLTNAMSLCLDLPDDAYDWVQLSGAWARERQIKVRPLEPGVVSVGSMRGNSSHEHNPFVILKRPDATEHTGEVIGCSLIYSGNFLMQAEVDAHSTTRLLAGIHPHGFDWKLKAGDRFHTPEAVLVYSDEGMNKMSQTFHKLYQKRLARGYWRDKVRPILINNWEATYFDFTEERLLEIAKKAKSCGVELFVLDDGWFGGRRHEKAGLGDWIVNPELLPEGITGLAEKMECIGMKFGLWFEPEMVNEDSDLFRAHPDWILATPNRARSHGRFQYVLDYSRKEVVDAIYEMMAKILSEAKVSYVKWDMNRSISECYSAVLPANQQGEVFHRYILGVYDLYERLTSTFPKVLFESCASGGGRFDPGILYYAPQGWTSDDTDAVERMKIQYGTSLCYPVSSMGSHVSVVPNHQLNRMTPLHTRANVAYFGTFGYELDLNKLTEEEIVQVKEQIAFMKEYREVIQYGTFYRLKSPFEGNVMSWMAVSEDQKCAIVGWYRVLNMVNGDFTRVKLTGLNPDFLYTVDVYEKTCRRGGIHYGDELMYLGLNTTDDSAGQVEVGEQISSDYASRVYVLRAE